MSTHWILNWLMRLNIIKFLYKRIKNKIISGLIFLKFNIYI